MSERCIACRHLNCRKVETFRNITLQHRTATPIAKKLLKKKKKRQKVIQGIFPFHWKVSPPPVIICLTCEYSISAGHLQLAAIWAFSMRFQMATSFVLMVEFDPLLTEMLWTAHCYTLFSRHLAFNWLNNIKSNCILTFPQLSAQGEILNVHFPKEQQDYPLPRLHTEILSYQRPTIKHLELTFYLKEEVISFIDDRVSEVFGSPQTPSWSQWLQLASACDCRTWKQDKTALMLLLISKVTQQACSQVVLMLLTRETGSCGERMTHVSRETSCLVLFLMKKEIGQWRRPQATTSLAETKLRPNLP